VQGIAERHKFASQHETDGEPTDFDRFVLAQLHSLIRYASLLTRSRDVAEDIVQEALIKTHAKWKRISILDSPERYVRRIVTNEFLSQRRRRRLPTVELRAAHTEVAQQDRPPSHEQTTADRDALLAELERLPPQQRAVLVLRFYEGLTDVEIAGVLGCRPGTVRGYSSRALSTLRIEFDERHGAEASIRSQERS